MQAPSRVMPKKETSLTVCDDICPAVGRFWDDSVIIVIVSEGRGWGARKSFLRFMAMDIGEGEAAVPPCRPSVPSIPRKRTEMEKMEEKELAAAA